MLLGVVIQILLGEHSWISPVAPFFLCLLSVSASLHEAHSSQSAIMIKRVKQIPPECTKVSLTKKSLQNWRYWHTLLCSCSYDIHSRNIAKWKVNYMWFLLLQEFAGITFKFFISSRSFSLDSLSSWVAFLSWFKTRIASLSIADLSVFAGLPGSKMELRSANLHE